MTATLYGDLTAAGIPVENHESDLYFPATATSLDILNRHPLQESNARQFTSQIDGKLWMDVPFAFLPWWEKRTKQPATLQVGPL